jgi:hypothetical protein
MDPDAVLSADKQLELDAFRKLLVDAANETLSKYSLHLGMAYNNRRRGGIVIDVVRKGKAAAMAGLRAKDQLSAIDGVFIQNRDFFTKYIIENHKAGDTLVLTKQSNLTGQSQINMVVGAKGVSMNLFLKIVRMANGDVPAEYMVDIRLLQEIGICDDDGTVLVTEEIDSSTVLLKAEQERARSAKKQERADRRKRQGLAPEGKDMLSPRSRSRAAMPTSAASRGSPARTPARSRKGSPARKRDSDNYGLTGLPALF